MDFQQYANSHMKHGGEATDIPHPWTLQVADRLAKIIAILDDATGDQNMLSDRLFGSSPRNAGLVGVGGPANLECAAERINNQLGLLEGRAAEIGQGARSLNQRI